jgi:hypothetical protein
MEYGTPQKLPNGRYFLKVGPVRHQVNGLVLQDSLATKTVNFKVKDSSLFTGIDAEIISKAKESTVEWFRKELTSEVISAAYQESVSDDVLEASLVTVRGDVRTTVFDSQKNPMELQAVTSGTTCDVVLELSGLWFLKKSFGPIWRIVQVRTRAAPKSAPSYLFTDDPVEEQEVDDPSDYIDFE